MIIDLQNITFSNDFFSIDLPQGGTFIINKMDESIKLEGSRSADIKNLNLFILNYRQDTTEQINCTCIIGMGNEYLRVFTDYKECEGQVLTYENMKYCQVELYE